MPLVISFLKYLPGWLNLIVTTRRHDLFIFAFTLENFVSKRKPIIDFAGTGIDTSMIREPDIITERPQYILHRYIENKSCFKKQA
ncbi:hypothetical protein D3C73_1556370 [compost metagenome]